MVKVNAEATAGPSPSQQQGRRILISKLYQHELVEGGLLMRQFSMTKSDTGIFFTCRTCARDRESVVFSDTEAARFGVHLGFHGMLRPNQPSGLGGSHAQSRDGGLDKANTAIEALEYRVASCEKMEGACMDNVAQQEIKIRQLQQMNIDQRQQISHLTSQVGNLMKELQNQRDSQRLLMEKWGKKSEMDSQCIKHLYEMHGAAEKIHLERLEFLSQSTGSRVKGLESVIQEQQATLDKNEQDRKKSEEVRRQQKRKMEDLEDDQIVMLLLLQSQERKRANRR